MKSNGLLFNCEFGPTSGWGHITRCSALASTAKSMGIKTGLITNGDISMLPEEIRHSYDSIFDNIPIFPSQETCKKIYVDNNTWEALFLDNYSYNATDLTRLSGILQNYNIKLAIIDDFHSKRTKEAHWAIIPGLAGENLCIEDPCIMTGLDYCLLRPGFTALNSPLKKTPSSPLKVAIMLGGTDPFKLTPKAVKFLSQNNPENYEPIIFFSKKPKNEGIIRESLKAFPKYQWLERQSSDQLASWFSKCDFAITACGGTIYEMAKFNLPFMGIISVQNQEFTGQKIQTTWGLPVLLADEFNQTNFKLHWDHLLKNFSDRSKPYTNIDGNGCQRIIESMLTGAYPFKI